jgi:hypothetical protein
MCQKILVCEIPSILESHGDRWTDMAKLKGAILQLLVANTNKNYEQIQNILSLSKKLNRESEPTEYEGTLLTT